MKYLPSPGIFVAPRKLKRQVVIIGGGHNALVCSAYLARSGLTDCAVLERRNCVGGAAVTEEIMPGFKFSRASYLAGLLRPQIINELNLEKYGFKYLTRDPSSFTPTLSTDDFYKGRSLLLGANDEDNRRSIAQFSLKDADQFTKYEEFLGKIRDIVNPLLDSYPPNILSSQAKVHELKHSFQTAIATLKQLYRHRSFLPDIYEFMTAPAEQILNKWFESEILKTTLATDAVVGALVTPRQTGSAYVLLHHVMGEAAGRKGVWAYVEGGMGRVSESIAAAAREVGVEISLNASVKKLLTKTSVGARPKVSGVMLEDGTVIEADIVVSGCTPFHTFAELLDVSHDEKLQDYVHRIKCADYSCASFKINLAVDQLPNFTCMPSPADRRPGPMHRGTIHFESRLAEIDRAYHEAASGRPATRPVIEMTIPSAVDPTLAPPGKHVVQLFVQFAPYDVDPQLGTWEDPAFKQAFADRCYRVIEEYCPGFTASIIGSDVLSPLDLERVFGLHRGSISHGAISIHQIAYARPLPGHSSHRTPVDNLYLCSAGCHPGGGVMGAAGKNAARVILSDLGLPLNVS